MSDDYTNPQNPEGCPAVIPLSDGVRIILGDGTVAHLSVETDDGDELIERTGHVDGGVFGGIDHDTKVSVGIMSDHEAAQHPMVRENLEELGFWNVEPDGECGRCDGDGMIEGNVEAVPCPFCEDVCQWCNKEYDDGEELGDTGLSVCRDCIRDMAAYKEDVSWQLHVTNATDDYLENAEQFRADLDAAIESVFGEYGLSTETGAWDVRLNE